MDGTTYTTINKALKYDYLPNLHRQVDKFVQTWDIFSKSQEGVKGRDIYMKMFKEYPQGVGAAAAGELLPTPSGAGYEEAKIQSKRNYGTIQFDAMIEKDKTAEEGGQVTILTRKPKWMAVSLDLFDIKPN